MRTFPDGFGGHQKDVVCGNYLLHSLVMSDPVEKKPFGSLLNVETTIHAHKAAADGKGTYEKRLSDGKNGGDAPVLSSEDLTLLEELKLRDRRVRAHEEAHAAIGGPFAGPPQYDYVVGPDGKNYVVEGHVLIDILPVEGDLDATIRKMKQVRAAAMAPADVSNDDLTVAAMADIEMDKALKALRKSRGFDENDVTSLLLSTDQIEYLRSSNAVLKDVSNQFILIEDAVSTQSNKIYKIQSIADITESNTLEGKVAKATNSYAPPQTRPPGYFVQRKFS